MEQASNKFKAPETACKWIATATAIFRRLERFEPKTRLQFFSGNGNAKIYYDGTTSSFVVAYSGNSRLEATRIFDALKPMQRKRQLTIENFESIEPPTFLLQARILS